MCLYDKVIEALLRLDRRVDRVEDVASDEQGVGAACLELCQQPIEKTGVFEVAILTMKGLAKMPVGSMKNTHGVPVQACGRGVAPGPSARV
ncbi:Uncharacterised protein [Pseudomonas luteola]|uniref:Uncharacterized protein n=1 Tax=Pseudomonas luteola TaxID=47886 RepID=A0A2X2CJI3_PSELU|nr:Uncharacterised protein [Pseudomonas luteola]